MAVKSKQRRSKAEVTAALSEQLRVERDLIREYADKRAAAMRRRDALIEKLCDRGESERQIARDAGVTGPRVNQIYHGTYSRNGEDE